MTIYTVIVFISIAFICDVSAACERGWFGPKCEYKCHCNQNAVCDVNGSCVNKCASGWFGPACQYTNVAEVQSLTTTPGRLTFYLTDGDDSTCVENITSLTFNVTAVYQVTIFSWLRITMLNEEMATRTVSLSFKSYYTGAVDFCEDLKSYVVDRRTRDVSCYRTHVSSFVYIVFSSETTVCSLQISGGRNVALKQQVTMSSLFHNDAQFNGSNAVDGAFSSNCKFGGCAFTEVNTSGPSMVVTLSLPAFVYRFVFHSGLYANGNMTYIQSWINFTAYNSEGLHTVAGRGEKAFIKTLSIYTGEIFEPIKTVIISDDNTTDGSYIILQEVELYGESFCPAGTHCLGCLKTCNCAVRGESCLVSTGGCPSGCPIGLHGSDCKETCDSGYYGISCLLTCSSNCSDQSCDQTTGHCFKCHPGYYGDTCEFRCSDHCAGDGMCDVNGTCLYGCSDGYHGDTCLDACDVLKYGTSCTQTCSTNCKTVEPAGSTTCHFVTGACLLGCRSGYLEPTCSEAPESTSHVVNIIIGVGVVVVLVVLIVVVGCVVYRRLRRVREDVGSGSTNNNTTGFDKPDYTIYNGRVASSQEYYRKGGLPQQIYTQHLSVSKTSEEEIYDCIQYDSNTSSVLF